MPRGGGFRGGFRGGGFRGGGLRGGGFRGGPGSFRMGNVRTSGRPFGRTGATRIVSRSPRGPYSHTMYRPRRYYYRPWWWYHRPWYYRWWYSPWWAGHYYRPWYYSPMYIGGGIVFLILMALILLPAFGVAMLFPFSEADVNGNVNYRSTETLYFNEFWYEYENIEAGNNITFSIQSSPANISFAIWDRPFEYLPTTILNGSEVGPESLLSDEYHYLQLFLRPESVIEYDYNSTDLIDFFIGDGYDLYIWNQGGSPSFYVEEANSNQGTGDLVINEAKDYYVVWYNDGISSVDVDFTVNYTATNIVDFTGTEFYVLDTDFIPQQTRQVPNSGNWYFFIYFDPLNSPEESTLITFDVSYDTGITSIDRWLEVSPILIIITVIVVILIIAAVIARKGQKKLKSKAPPKPAAPTEPSMPTKPLTPTTPTQKAPPPTYKCIRCGTTHSPDAQFCPNCGGKIQGRQLGTPSVTTPAMSKTCSYCGSKFLEKDKFCKWCGTKIEQ